jgi:hypothetical protein
MADFNQVVVDPKTFFVQGGLQVDPTTILTPPKQFDKQTVRTMTVANGTVLKVYDVTDPTSPVLIQTIG